MTRGLPHVIRNDWERDARGPFLVARILDHRTHPGGLDVERVRFVEAGHSRARPRGRPLRERALGSRSPCAANGTATLRFSSRITTHALHPGGLARAHRGPRRCRNPSACPGNRRQAPGYPAPRARRDVPGGVRDRVG